MNPRLENRIVCGAAAILLGGSAGAMLWRAIERHADYLQIPALLGAGAALVFLYGAVAREGRIQRAIRGCALMLINTAVVFGFAEVACRVLRFDFNELLGLRANNERFPIYFRLPAKPAGDVYFTRHGPAEWTGKPLTVLLRNHKITDNAYQDEQELTVRYDKDGFRNADDLTDWEIAITGDSFVESGYLPWEAIFPTIVASRLSKPIKNLGSSDSGLFSEAFFLRTYGKAPSLKSAVLAFFEGNDITDNLEERRNLHRFQTTGERPQREIGREPSLLRTLYRMARNLDQVELFPRSYANAMLNAGGTAIPVTIADAPPAPEALSEEERAALGEGLDAWALACRELNVEAWLLYLPAKRRVFHDHLTQATDYPEPDWQLNALPAHLATLCQERAIHFVDATPALREATNRGEITYNTIYDTHLSMNGHRVVAEVLAAALEQGKGIPTSLTTAR